MRYNKEPSSNFINLAHEIHVSIQDLADRIKEPLAMAY